MKIVNIIAYILKTNALIILMITSTQKIYCSAPASSMPDPCAILDPRLIYMPGSAGLFGFGKTDSLCKCQRENTMADIYRDIDNSSALVENKKAKKVVRFLERLPYSNYVSNYLLPEVNEINSFASEFCLPAANQLDACTAIDPRLQFFTESKWFTTRRDGLCICKNQNRISYLPRFIPERTRSTLLIYRNES